MAEVLAPAGSFEALISAVRCGADAVYLGGYKFNARGNAQNFDKEALKEAVKYCHERKVKVYLTLNTLLSDSEINEAKELISFCAEIGIDAFIVQDLSLIDIIKNLAPNVHLHASTQMTVQSSEAVNFLEKLGFTRVVVPRELTREEIKFLSDNTNIELEVFVHGALCMCMSGQCYMSAMLGSRSGNRGLCAQPCRLSFSADDSGSCDLSLKDNSLIPHLRELDEMGIASFKIEGRMKRPEYVAAAVTSCKNSLKNIKDGNIEKALRAVFSRQGFTDGYYLDKRDRNMFGTRIKEDVTAAKEVLKDLSKLYEKETQKFKVNFTFKMEYNKPLKLKAECENIYLEAESECVAEKAVKREITEADIKEQLSKLGGTQFFAGNISCEIENGLSVPLSKINQLRRDVIEKISEAFLTESSTSFTKKDIQEEDTFLSDRPKCKIEKTYLILKNENQIPQKLDENFLIVLPLNTDEKVFEKLIKENKNVSCEMPRGIFTHTDKIKIKAKKLISLGVSRFFCPTLDSALIIKDLGAKITASFGSNIFNSITLNMWKKYFCDEAILSPEMTVKDINNIKGDAKTGIICYGRLPLMITRNCPVKNKFSCSQCQKNGTLTDRKGLSFPVDCTSGTSEILNSVPINVCDELSSFENINFAVLKFTDEDKNECEDIIKNYINRKKSDGKFTRGLYHRGVI